MCWTHPQAAAPIRLMSNSEIAYAQLTTHLKEVALFGSIGSLLGWDERVQMPPAGAEHRANQSSLLARKVHEQFTSPHIDQLLREIETGGLSQDGDARVVTAEVRRLYDRATKLP